MIISISADEVSLDLLIDDASRDMSLNLLDVEKVGCLVLLLLVEHFVASGSHLVSLLVYELAKHLLNLALLACLLAERE